MDKMGTMKPQKKNRGRHPPPLSLALYVDKRKTRRHRCVGLFLRDGKTGGNRMAATQKGEKEETARETSNTGRRKSIDAKSFDARGGFVCIPLCVLGWWWVRYFGLCMHRPHFLQKGLVGASSDPSNVLYHSHVLICSLFPSLHLAPIHFPALRRTGMSSKPRTITSSSSATPMHLPTPLLTDSSVILPCTVSLSTTAAQPLLSSTAPSAERAASRSLVGFHRVFGQAFEEHSTKRRSREAGGACTPIPLGEEISHARTGSTGAPSLCPWPPRRPPPPRASPPAAAAPARGPAPPPSRCTRTPAPRPGRGRCIDLFICLCWM